MQYTHSIAMFAMLGLSASNGWGEFVTVYAVQSATIYQEDTNAANGSGQYLFAGRTNQGFARRSLLRFDLSALPIDALLQSVSVGMNVAQGNGGIRPMSLHRATQQWTTGASDPAGTESVGVAAMIGDCSWAWASSNGALGGTPWNDEGGSFQSVASATSSTTVMGMQSWTSETLRADVESWLANPNENFGWFLLGDETVAGTSRRLDSAHAVVGGFLPSLQLEYTLAPAPSAVAMLGISRLLIGTRKRTSGQARTQV